MDDAQRIQRRRRVGVQVLLWLVLAGAVGLAVVVNQSVVRPQRVEAGGVGLQLPRQWQVVDPADPRVIIYAIDPDRGRDLAVVRQRVAPGSSPSQYLLQSGLVSPDYRREARGRIVRQSPLRMAGQTGLLFVGVRADRRLGEARKELRGTVILPDGEAVTILLDGIGQPSALDVMLLQRVADTLVVRPRS